MAIDPQVIHSERFQEIGTLIQRDAGVLLERWCRRAVEEQSAAQRVHHEVLRDQLATFLECLGRALAESVEDPGPQCLPALQHGEQRWENGWSLAEVVRDFQILRLVLVEYLEEALDRPLAGREVMAVGLGIDEAITASVGIYVSNRDEYVRRLERERLAQEEQAAEALRRWQQIFHHAPLGIAVLHPQTHALQAVNPAFAAMHGYGVDEVLGRPVLDLLAPASRAQFPGEPAPGENGHRILEAVHVRKDGTTFPVRTHVITMRDGAGHVLYRAATFEDVTEHKLLEESLRHEAEALQEADRRKDEFLATLAHELRNPLAPIATSIEVLRLIGPDDSVLQQTREMVERQVKQLARIVDDLLDLSRISRGKIELRKEAVDLAEVVRQAVYTSQPLVQARLHRLTVSLPEAPLRLEADQARLVQIVVNLLNNAAKYTERGGQIWAAAERQGNEAVLRVRDTGVGIPPELLGHIFDMFMQVEESSERTQGGLGIGLTLVRRLVELHGGTITAHSDGLGQGSEFTVRLPALPPTMDGPAGPAGATPALPATARHILIVEDNADGRSSLQTLLQLSGHRVDVAEDGPRGVQVAEQVRPQVALIDLGLPGLDGYQVAERLRASLGQSVLLVAMTGYGQDGDRRRALEAGFDAHLVKPVDLAELTKLLAGLPPE